MFRLPRLRPFALACSVLLFLLGFALWDGGTPQVQAQDPDTRQLMDAAGAGGEPQAAGGDAKSTPTAPDGSLLDPLQGRAEALSGDSPVLAILYDIFFRWGVTVDGQKINLAKILIALLVFVLGVRLSHRARGVMRRRFRDRGDYMLFLERLLGISIVALFAVLAMDVAGIPLKAFAFLGGAIAIAIGFGAQEVLANFISGLILMFEKPIRVGDLVEFDGDRGKVADIGPRCTRVRAPGNVDLLIPNKKLLEGKLINWTLTDDQVRTDVVVGIAYGSDTRKAEALLYQAAAEHPRVDKAPGPVVLFEQFGDNSLNFRIAFWITVHDFMEQQTIQSDLRFRIDELFREAGISIAFPQRDVHLDTLSPLQVRVVQGDGKD